MKDKVISLARKSGGLFFASSIALLFNLLFVFFLARLLGAEQYGYIPLTRSSQLILEAFLELGLAAALIKRLSSKDGQEMIIGTSLTLKVAAGGISTAALILLSLYSPEPMNLYLLAISPFPLFAFLFSNMRSIYSSRMDIWKASVLAVLPDLLRFAIAILLFFLGLGALSGILGFTLSAAASLAVAAAFLHKDRLLHLSFSMEEAKKQLTLGLFLNTPQLSTYFFPSFVTILSAFLLSITDVSIIAVSLSFASLIYVFISPLTSFLYPFACENYNDPKFSAFLRFLIRYWSAFLLVSVLGAGLASSFAFGLLGKSFLSGSPIFLAIALAVFLDSFKSISDYYLIAQNRQRLITAFEGSKFLVFFSLCIYRLLANGAISLDGLSKAILASFAFSFILRLGVLYKSCSLEPMPLLKAGLLLCVFIYFSQNAVGIEMKAAAFIAGLALIPAVGLLKLEDLNYLLEIAGLKKTSGGNKK